MRRQEVSVTTVARVYLPGLNGVRAIAASAVVLGHIEQGKKVFGLASWFSPEYPWVFRAGELGVTLFFVLSGFLISYLLLAELKETGTVAVRHFYIRRILRIWPLYYLIVFLGWAVAPRLALFQCALFVPPSGPDVLGQLAFYVLLIPQLVTPRFASATLAGPLWSVGVEEQFYLFWPLITRWARHRFARVCVAILAGTVLARFGLTVARYFIWPGTALEPILDYLLHVLTWCRFSCMALGGWGAYLCFTQHPALAVLFRRDIQFLALAGLAAWVIRGSGLPFIDQETYALSFIVLIVNVAFNPRAVLKLESRVFTFLGEISYGFYVFHWFVIVAVLNTLAALGLARWPWAHQIAVYVLSIGITLLVAALSHRFFERPFLRLKDGFAVIQSGRPAPER